MSSVAVKISCRCSEAASVPVPTFKVTVTVLLVAESINFAVLAGRVFPLELEEVDEDVEPDDELLELDELELDEFEEDEDCAGIPNKPSPLSLLLPQADRPRARPITVADAKVLRIFLRLIIDIVFPSSRVIPG